MPAGVWDDPDNVYPDINDFEDYQSYQPACECVWIIIRGIFPRINIFQLNVSEREDSNLNIEFPIYSYGTVSSSTTLWKSRSNLGSRQFVWGAKGTSG